MRWIQRFLPVFILAAATAASLLVRGQVWPDVLVDSGRELYVPWRLLHGAVLYRDIAYFNGPLSAYFNAAIFRVGGTSLRSLEAANILVIAGVIAMFYWLARRCAGRFAATMGGLTFIGLFAFSQITPFHGYNWVFPYSHEMTHGIALSLASLCALVAFAERRAPLFLLAAGAALGLAFLTKAEAFAAGAVTDVVLLALLLPRQEHPLVCLGWWGVGVVVPLAVAFGALCLALPVPDALAGVAGAWRYILSNSQADELFYRFVMGTNTPAVHLMNMSLWAAVYVLVLSVPVLFCERARPWGEGVAGVFALLAAGGAAILYYRSSWLDLAMPLPLGMIAVIVLAGMSWWKTRSTAACATLGMAVFGLALLAKMILHVKAYFYGFGLAAPAMVLAVVVLMDQVPAAIRRRWGAAVAFRAVVFVMWLAVIVAYSVVSLEHQRLATAPIGQDGDRFLAPPDRGKAVGAILAVIDQRSKAGDTMVVFPEGVMLNYLARLPNPTPYVNFMPIELSLFGQENMAAALRSHPPKFVVLADKDTSEYGYRYFGQNYGQELMQWVRENYKPLGVAGHLPFHNEGFGVMLLERKDG